MICLKNHFFIRFALKIPIASFITHPPNKNDKELVITYRLVGGGRGGRGEDLWGIIEFLGLRTKGGSVITERPKGGSTKSVPIQTW